MSWTRHADSGQRGDEQGADERLSPADVRTNTVALVRSCSIVGSGLACDAAASTQHGMAMGVLPEGPRCLLE